VEHRKEFLAVVLEKLLLLQDHITAGHCSDATIREISAALRFLLLDAGALQRAWKMCGFARQPQVVQSPGSLALSGDEDLVLGFKGGTILGQHVPSVRVHGRALSAEEIMHNYRKDCLDTATQTSLSAFLDEPCIRLRDSLVTRRAAIKYVANKLGGVHFDSNRDGGFERMRYEIKVLGRDSLLLQVLAIAERLVQSPDIQRLISRAKDDLAE